MIHLGRLTAALARLDALLERFPALREPAARARLTKALDDDDDGGDRGNDGSQEEGE